MSALSEATGHDASGPAAGPAAAPVPADRPEVPIGIAFAGGFLLAKIIQRLGK